jgi:hypothetical protein
MMKLATRGMTAPRPVKKLHISTTGFANRIIMGGTISLARKEVIQILTQISIQINLPERPGFRPGKNK